MNHEPTPRTDNTAVIDDQAIDDRAIDGPQPTDNFVKVEAGTGAAVHQLEINDFGTGEVSEENRPLEERDA